MRLLAKMIVIALLNVSIAFAGNAQTAVMNLQNIYCYACMQTVQKALQKVPGVEETKVDLEKKTATVKYDPAKTNVDSLMQATKAAGFPSTIAK